MDTSVLRVEQLSQTFYDIDESPLKALDKVSILGKSHELILLVGPNGAGKTTLFNTISGILFPDKGKIFIAGKEVTNAIQHKRARYVWQMRQNSSDGVCEGFTVRDILRLALIRDASGRWDRWCSLKDDDGKFISILSRVDLRVPLDRQTTALSGGERQLLGIVISMLVPPKVLLLDEPTANLDPSNREILENAIRVFVDSYDSVVLWICHEIPLIWNRVNRVFWMQNGELSEKSKDNVLPWLENTGLENNA